MQALIIASSQLVSTLSTPEDLSHVQPVDMPLMHTPLTCALLLSLCFHFVPLFNVHQPPLLAFSVYKNLVLYLFYITKTKNFHSLYKSSFLALLGMCLRMQ